MTWSSRLTVPISGWGLLEGWPKSWGRAVYKLKNQCFSVCSLVAKSLTLCNPMDCSMPCFPVHHQLLELAQTHVHLVGDSTITSSLFPFSSCLQSFPASVSFPASQFFAAGGQSIGASASASVLPMTIQDWFPLRWMVGSPCCPRDSQGSSLTP